MFLAETLEIKEMVTSPSTAALDLEERGLMVRRTAGPDWTVPRARSSVI